MLLLTWLLPISAQSQLVSIDPEDEYTQVLITRVDNFLSNILDQNDEATYIPARNIVIKQYIDLSIIHENRDVAVSDLQKNRSMDDDARELAIELVRLEAEEKMYRLHAEFLGRLLAHLTLDQAEAVKDGITYGTLAFTMQGYTEQHPDMTPDQKKFTYANLYTARELAMDKGSSDEKHRVFRNYKGIINNYLAGITYPDTHTYDPEYVKSLVAKVDGFLGEVLAKSDSAKYAVVQNITVQQYKDLGNLYAELEEELTQAATDDLKKKARLSIQKDINDLHATFKGKLRAELTFAEMEQIKDGMTGNAFRDKLDAFKNQKPTMSDLQSRFSHGAFYAARELAMDLIEAEDMTGVFDDYQNLSEDYLAGKHNVNDHMKSEIEDTVVTEPIIEPLNTEGLNMQGLEIYPNPAQSFVTLKINGIAAIKELGIFDLSGSLVVNLSDRLDSVENIIELDLNGWQSGCYLIKAGDQYSKKLIIK